MWYKELNSDWQAQLDRPIGAKHRVKVVFDPSGDNVDLSERLASMGALVQKKNILPGKLGQYIASQVNLKFNDPDSYFNELDAESFLYGTDWYHTEVQIKSKMAGTSSDVNQGLMYLEAVKLEKANASFVLVDLFKVLLDEKLTADTYNRIKDGVSQSTISYERTGSSTGTLDDMTIYSTYCKLGQWTITFTDGSGNYTVDGPGVTEKEGSTGSDFYSNTDATDSQIKIASGDWTGTFDEGDSITFSTCRTWENKVLIEIIHDLAKTMLSDSDIDKSGTYPSTLDTDYSFDRAHNWLALFKLSISFDRTTTVLKAIELVANHGNSTPFSNRDGKLAIDVYRPKYQDSFYNLQNYNDLKECKSETLAPIEAFRIFFNYDYENSAYLNEYVYPNDATEDIFEIKLHGFTSEDAGLVHWMATFYYNLWHDGVRVFDPIKEKLHALAIDIGEHYYINSLNPVYENRAIEIIETQKRLLKRDISLKAFDVNSLMGDISAYCFCDVGHKCDDGRIIW